MKETIYNVKTIKALRVIRSRRKKCGRLLDKIIIKLFPGTLARWASAHLDEAFNWSLIDSRTLHEMDSQMKTDLNRPGFKYKRAVR